MLAALLPLITTSDIILAHPLSLPPEPRSRIAVLLSSASLVSKVLLAKSTKIHSSTDALDISLLGSELSKHFGHCKIFVNEALYKERFKHFCSLKSAAKKLGIRYVWHRGWKFMAQVREVDGVHVFESLSDLQVIRNVSRFTVVRSLQPDIEMRAAEANVPNAELAMTCGGGGW